MEERVDLVLWAALLSSNEFPTLHPLLSTWWQTLTSSSFCWNCEIMQPYLSWFGKRVKSLQAHYGQRLYFLPEPTVPGGRRFHRSLCSRTGSIRAPYESGWFIALGKVSFHLEDAQSKTNPVTDLIGPYFSPSVSVQCRFLISGP